MTNFELTDGDIIIRPFRLDYAEQHLAGDDEENIKWLSGGISTLETVQNWISRNQKSWENNGPIYSFAIFDTKTNQLVGMVDANSSPDAAEEGLKDGAVNISYSIYPFARGKGYATRAVNLILNFLKKEGFRTALIRVHPHNEKSLGVPARAGFTRIERISTENGERLIVFEKVLNQAIR